MFLDLNWKHLILDLKPNRSKFEIPGIDALQGKEWHSTTCNASKDYGCFHYRTVKYYQKEFNLARKKTKIKDAMEPLPKFWPWDLTLKM